jgi:hypothetical protein
MDKNTKLKKIDKSTEQDTNYNETLNLRESIPA